MSVLFILIACSLLLAGSFLTAFLWASHNGQFEDDYTPSVRMLMDDEVPHDRKGEDGSKREASSETRNLKS